MWWILRDIISKFGIPLAVLIIVLACAFFWLSARGRKDVDVGDASLAYFVNEATNEEFILASDQIPPIPGPDGTGTLVLAAKFRGDCDPAPKTYYLIKYADATKAQIEALSSDDPGRLNLLGEQLVRVPGPGNAWTSIHDADADRIISVPECAAHSRRVRVSPPHR